MASASPAEAAGHNVFGWAWSGTTGWISVDCESSPGGCAANGDYGLNIDSQKRLHGWAWSVNAGWICFGDACVPGVAGVPAAGTPSVDHYCPSHSPCANYDPATREFHGWAYVLSETDTVFRGWISLNCTDVDPNTASPHSCGAADYAVKLDPPTGNLSGYGWNGNGDTTGNGWINFACSASRPCSAPDWGVSTNWVMSSWSGMKQQEGIYSSAAGASSGLTSIPMTFEHFSAAAGSILNCYLMRSDNSGKTVSWPITTDIVDEEYTQNYTVDPTDPLVDSSGNPVVWTFSGPGGIGCEITGDPTQIVPYQAMISNRIAVHPSGWSFTGPGGSLQSDANRASFCLQGNLGAFLPSRGYFLNMVQCDTEGDLASALLKSKGVPVEVQCSDNLDNDANFQRDCAGGIPVTAPDRNCRGITYLCIPHTTAPTSAPPLP